MLRLLLVLAAVAAMAPGGPAVAGSSVLDRPPGAGDVGPAYQQDMLWLDQAGRSWAMRDFGKTRAVWRSLEPTARLLDEIGGTGPVAAYGMTAEVVDRLRGIESYKDSDVGGIGGTLAGYALSMAAARAALGEVLTEAAFDLMAPLAARWQKGVDDAITRHGAPWSVTRLGTRAEYHFLPHPPRDGAEQVAHADAALERLLHLWVMNRGVLMTPFHNMALFSPSHVAADVDRHTEVFAEAVAALVPVAA